MVPKRFNDIQLYDRQCERILAPGIPHRGREREIETFPRNEKTIDHPFDPFDLPPLNELWIRVGHAFLSIPEEMMIVASDGM